jgi:hypothetical protein
VCLGRGGFRCIKGHCRTIQASPSCSAVRAGTPVPISLPIEFARDNFRLGAVGIGTPGRSSRSGIEHSRSTGGGESQNAGPVLESRSES